MSKWNDLFNIFKKQPLNFIDCYKEYNDVYTFLFEKPADLDWKSGQHGLFHITHKKIKNGIRPFSIASISAEDRIQVTTKIGENKSEFKQALLELEKGMQIRLSGPVGSFYLKDSSPTLLIAGGVGVTPFRSILKQLEHDKNPKNQKVTLLYLSSKQEFLFKEDLDQAASTESISVSYIHSREEIFKEIQSFIDTHGNDGRYFTAGSSSFIQSVSDYLKENKVSKRQVKKGKFYGYA